MKWPIMVVVLVCIVALVRHDHHSGGFCSTHACIGNFDNANGYIVQCNDGTWSHSGGIQGACSYHGGER